MVRNTMGYYGLVKFDYFDNINNKNFFMKYLIVLPLVILFTLGFILYLRMIEKIKKENI